MTEFLDQLVQFAGPFLAPLLGLAALVEYVFPPFPGDTITLVGAVLALRGEVDAWAVYLAVNLGSVLGALIDYGAGAWLRGHLESTSRFAMWLRTSVLTPELTGRLEVQSKRWGLWLIVFNRFVPVTRSLFFVFAGLARMKLLPVMLLGTLSALAWNALIFAVGWAVGANLPALERFFTQYNRIALGVLGVGLVVGLVVWLRRRRQPAPPPPAPQLNLLPPSLEALPVESPKPGEPR